MVTSHFSWLRYAALWVPIGEEFCPSTRTAVHDGIAMLLGSVICKGIQSNTAAFIVVCPLTSQIQGKFGLNCAAFAGLTVVMSGRLLTK